MEVLIVMVVIAVLAAIALPNYTESVNRGHRSDAKAMLLQASQWLERFRTENNAYDADAGGNAIVFPTSMSASPPAPATARYTIGFDAVTPISYTLRARAVNAQATDSCGDFLIDQAGLRQIFTGGTMVNSGPLFDRCWGR